MAIYTSRDGLMSSNDPARVADWEAICDRQNQEQLSASEALRAMGVKLEHPDDGWVDREKNSITPSYPRFNSRPEVGDLIALGWPWSGYRIVRVTRVEHGGILIPTTTYSFEDTGERIEGNR